MNIFKTLWKWISAGIASNQTYASLGGIDPVKNADSLMPSKNEAHCADSAEVSPNSTRS